MDEMDEMKDDAPKRGAYGDGPEPADVELPDDDHVPVDICPHGESWTACQTCMIAADLAFDSARESR